MFGGLFIKNLILADWLLLCFSLQTLQRSELNYINTDFFVSKIINKDHLNRTNPPHTNNDWLPVPGRSQSCVLAKSFWFMSSSMMHDLGSSRYGPITSMYPPHTHRLALDAHEDLFCSKVADCLVMNESRESGPSKGCKLTALIFSSSRSVSGENTAIAYSVWCTVQPKHTPAHRVGCTCQLTDTALTVNILCISREQDRGEGAVAAVTWQKDRITKCDEQNHMY